MAGHGPDDDDPLLTAATDSLDVSTPDGQATTESTLGISGVDIPPRVGVSPSRPDRLAMRYRLGERLGGGAFGTVYAALDERTGRTVAAKIMPALSSHEWTLVRREVVALRWARLPGIVRMLDEGTEGPHGFIVMEQVDGRHFPGVDQRDWSSVRPVVLAMLEALARLHAAGLVHRDLKPANVLVDAAGVPTIVDFGLATAAHKAPESRGGTAFYAAPEQFEPDGVPDGRTDLYSLGLMIYEALTGVVPHTSDSSPVADIAFKRWLEQAPPLRHYAPAVPELVEETVARMLAPSPEDRFPDAVAVIAALGGQPERVHPLLEDLAGVSDEASLRALFHGPEHFLHLPSDAARELWARTAGRAEAVRAELGAWFRAGLCYWDEGRVRIERQVIDRLAAGLRVDATRPRDPALSPRAREALDRLRLAWPDTHPEATLRGLDPAALIELRGHGLVWDLPDGRLGCRVVVEPALGWWVERRKAFHRRLAEQSDDPGAQIRHLLAAGPEDLLERLMPAVERCVVERPFGEAWWAIQRTLDLAREAQSPHRRRLMELLVLVGLAQEAAEPLESALLEVERAGEPGLADLEHLIRGARAARSGQEALAESHLERVRPFADEQLEHWRQAAWVERTRSLGLEARRAVLEGMQPWVAAGPAERAAVFAGWWGNFLYLDGRYREAAKHHAIAVEGKRRPWARLSSRLNHASALLEALDYESAAREAAIAGLEARSLGHPDSELRARWIERSALFRTDQAGPPIEGLVSAASFVSRVREGLFAVLEAAVAWRQSEFQIGRRLAALGRTCLGELGLSAAAALSAALEVACGGRLDGELLRELRSMAGPDGVRLQILALIASAGYAVPLDDFEALLGVRPATERALRLEVMSVDEAEHLLRGREMEKRSEP